MFSFRLSAPLRLRQTQFCQEETVCYLMKINDLFNFIKSGNRRDSLLDGEFWGFRGRLVPGLAFN